MDGLDMIITSDVCLPVSSADNNEGTHALLIGGGYRSEATSKGTFSPICGRYRWCPSAGLYS